MPSAELVQIGTPITWRDSGGTYAATLSSLANGAARLGARGDLSAFPNPYMYRWSLQTQWVATPTQFRSLDLFFAPWDDDATPGIPFANVGSADAAGTATDRYNMIYVGSVRVSAAGTGTMISGGLIELPYRYVSPFFFNDGNAALAAVGTFASILTLTPVYREGQ